MRLAASRRSARIALSIGVLVALAACGGGGGGGGGGFPLLPGGAQPPVVRYNVGGTVTGLASGNRLVLQNNASDDLALSANGDFTFSTPLNEGADYAITVRTQPLWQFCTASNATGKATADVRTVSVACAAALAKVITLAGSGAPGKADGVGAAASFNQPFSTAVDASGNVYVADSGNNLIRKITPAGEVSTLAGSGTRGNGNGTGAAASFSSPAGIAVDTNGNVYVADTDNALIRKITPAGEVSTLAGSGISGSTNGTGAAASFSSPLGIAVDTNGNVYVADTDNALIRKITPAGEVSTLAGSGTSGSTNGTGVAASFSSPFGIAVDTNGNVYVADYDNHLVRKITPAGEVSTLAGSGTEGSANGTGTAASFSEPVGIAVDASGYVYVTEVGTHLIRKITPVGEVSTLAGSGTAGMANGVGTAASFSLPAGIGVDSRGNLYVGDYGSNLIRKIVPTAP